MQMDSMMEKIVKYANGTDLTIFWSNRNLILQGKIDTVYESDNCLEVDNPDYKEFYACAFEIVKIIQKPINFEKKEGDLIEISVDNQPSLISLLDGTVVWMDLPDYLQSTYLMLVKTFPKGINEKYYWIILYLLYEYFADENLALVMAAFSGKSIAMVSNDIYGVNQMKFDSKLLDEVKNMLEANGFEEWKKDVL